VNYSPETTAAFQEWFPAHKAAFPSVPFPEEDDDKIGIYPGLAAVLIKNGLVDVDYLFEVTRRMVIAGEKTYDLQGHVRELIKTAIAFQREHYRPESAHPIDSMEAARDASADCETCHGMGIFLAHRQKSASPDRRDNTINVYCSCPYGRKIRENHRTNAPAAFRRFYDLDEHPWLADPVYRERPPLAETPETQRVLDRVAKVKEWFDAQDEETKEKYRQDAEINPRTNRREPLPFTKSHKYFDDFVCGIIASRNPEFCGQAPE
jgi:hypothetical protein